jgi:sn-glycerol 3-phosphate transport system ATP-binding protein
MALAVDLVEPLGSETLLHGTAPDGSVFLLRVPSPATGEAVVKVILPPAQLHVFDPATTRRIDPTIS